jgi:hypothetical protein
VGARATRTTHPEFLRKLEALLADVNGGGMEVRNPFEFMTRREICKLVSSLGAGELLERTVSCAHVHEMRREFPHCGSCSQCIDRRLAVISAGVREPLDCEGYRHDIANGGDNSSATQDMTLVGYIDVADRFRKFSNAFEFIAANGEAYRAAGAIAERSGEDVSVVAERIYQLHKRHGEGVSDAIAMIMASCAEKIRTPGALAANSLPLLMYEQGKQGVVQSGIEPRMLRKGDGWLIQFEGDDTYVKESIGVSYISYLLESPKLAFTAYELIDLREGRPPSRVGLPQVHGGIDEKTVRSLQHRLREISEDILEAETFDHTLEVERLTREKEKIENYLRQERGLGGREKEDPDRKKARNSVSRAITRALDGICKESEKLGEHLKERIDTGFYCQYRGEKLVWTVVR